MATDTTRDMRKFRGTDAEKETAIREVLDPLLATVSATETPDTAPVLTLLSGIIGGGVGATIEMPTLRVPLSSVRAWWVTGFTVHQPGGTGVGMVGVGVGMSF